MSRSGLAEARSPLVIVGSGGHAKVVIEIIRAQGVFDIIGCTDPGASGEVLGVPVLGGDERLDELWRDGIKHAFIALGSNALRVRIGRKLIQKGFQLPAIVHPAATISPTASLGRGVAVMAGAVVNAAAKIGDFAILNTLSSVDHDCVLGEGVHIAPRSALAGGVQLGDAVFFGVGASAIPNIHVGAHTTVGAGAVVVRDLPGGVTAVGAPARPLNKPI